MTLPKVGFHEQGWTDGLPIIPPTEDRVLNMLEASPAPADQVLGQLPPLSGTATVEKVAINAVMAGCKPDYFPVVLAGVKAVLQTQFNVGSITTTGGASTAGGSVSGSYLGWCRLARHGFNRHLSGFGAFALYHQIHSDQRRDQPTHKTH
jgi:hypothetical protein